MGALIELSRVAGLASGDYEGWGHPLPPPLDPSPGAGPYLHTRSFSMEERCLSDSWRELADDLISSDERLLHIRESNVAIGYLTSDKERTSQGRDVYGECEKVPDKYRWAIPYDFTIVIYEPNACRFADEQRRILMLHELLHIGIERDGNEERYSVRPHDIEDFETILQEHGMGWSG